MSIFEAREFWSTFISKNLDEEFDHNSIAIGNIDNDTSGNNKICISSMTGYLRFYEPHFGSKGKDIALYEKSYEEPILQIDLGNYIINSNESQLGILQSKRFFVIQVHNLKGATNIVIKFDHKLKRNGHNFTKGKIGEKNYDVIFIQSIDGAISIYEQDSLINIVVFSEVIFPGAIGYLSRKDSFIISNTAYEIECYSYNNLATTKKISGATKDTESKVHHNWKVNIGELTSEIQVIYNNISKREEIVALSETLLNLIDSNGKLLYQRKLDYEPMTIYAYNITDENYKANKIFDLMCMISSTQNHILIYKGLNLVWAVKVFDTPVNLSLNNFDHIKSLIVSLSENGNLSLLYLGMEQVKNKQIIHSKLIDQNFLLSETERLGLLIQNYSKGVVSTPSTTLSISADVNSNMFLDNEPGDKIFHKDSYGYIFRAQVILIFSYDGECANDIKVNIICPYNVICDDPIFSISSLKSTTGEVKKPVNFRVISELTPTFTNVDIIVSYYIISEDWKNEKILQSTSLTIELPLQLFLRVSHETKKDNNQCKITLCTDKNLLNLTEIFKDLTENYVDENVIKSKGNQATFIYPNKSEVTVIVSKQSGKYRIQSSQFEPILFILHQIAMRLNEHYEYQINLYIDDPINFQKLISLITNHFNLMQRKKELTTELEKYTSLYTIIQKSLLNKYKEKTPPQLYNSDFLLKQVYREINVKSDEIEKIIKEIKFCHRDIVIWTELILYLLKLRARMSEEHYQIVRNAFPLDSIYGNENSFEEVTFANMTNLILYYFKGAQDKLQEIKEIESLGRWQKIFVMLFKEIISHRGLIESENEEDKVKN